MSASDDRAIAVAAFNRAQDLFYSTRTPEQDHEMLQAALTSRHHWRLVGGERQFAVSDWLMSRIYAAFNEPRLAVEFALSSISHKQDGFPHWLKVLQEPTNVPTRCTSLSTIKKWLSPNLHWRQIQKR